MSARLSTAAGTVTAWAVGLIGLAVLIGAPFVLMRDVANLVHDFKHRHVDYVGAPDVRIAAASCNVGGLHCRIRIEGGTFSDGRQEQTLSFIASARDRALVPMRSPLDKSISLGLARERIGQRAFALAFACLLWLGMAVYAAGALLSRVNGRPARFASASGPIAVAALLTFFAGLALVTLGVIA